MTITYELGNSLYVNLTNKCSNDCSFCLRNNHSDVNGEDNLWLDREPAVEEIKADFLKRDMKKYDSVVFCGFGEPLERIDDVIAVGKWLKETYGIKIRVNTNGQANLIHKRDVTPEMEGVIDSVSISLNTDNAMEYQEICKSIFGEEAFFALQDFGKKAAKYVPEVIFSVVDTTISKEQIENCRKIAEDCGVKFRLREYIE